MTTRYTKLCLALTSVMVGAVCGCATSPFTTPGSHSGTFASYPPSSSTSPVEPSIKDGALVRGQNPSSLGSSPDRYSAAAATVPNEGYSRYAMPASGKSAPAGQRVAQVQAQPPLPPPYGYSPSNGAVGNGSPSYGTPNYGTPINGTPNNGTSGYGSTGYGPPAVGQPVYGQPNYGQPNYGQPAYGQPNYGTPAYGNPIYGAPPDPNSPYASATPDELPQLAPEFPPNFNLPGPTLPIDIGASETRTGRMMFGVGVNSELGVSGQIVVDERNFDWRRFPTSWEDIVNGTAWRGGGQGFRFEAMPGNQFQRYSVSFTEPYLYLLGFGSPFSLGLSGFYYNRRFFDWDEQRLGGRTALGYRLTHDLSLSAALRAEAVTIYNPRVIGEPALDRVIGDTELFTARTTLVHDTRDQPFFPTEGNYLELSYEQGFGTFDFPRGELDYRQYFLVRERPDGSGRHTLGYSFKFGVTGSQTPIFENFFAGGFSTMRGFDFRGASPLGAGGVVVGGQTRFLGSVEYFFPLTADDMIKGLVFCDFGTVEREVEFNADNYRVAPGIGLRIAIPALGPAPLALDLAFPVAHADTDDLQNFSFFIGINR